MVDRLRLLSLWRLKIFCLSRRDARLLLEPAQRSLGQFRDNILVASMLDTRCPTNRLRRCTSWELIGAFDGRLSKAFAA